MLNRLKQAFPDCTAYRRIALGRRAPTILPTNTPYREERITLFIDTKHIGSTFLEIDGYFGKFVSSVLDQEDAIVYVGTNLQSEDCWFSYDSDSGLQLLQGDNYSILPLCWKIFAALLYADEIRGTYHAVTMGW